MIRWLWHFALILAVTFFFQRSYLRSTVVDESAFACDSFGYLTMARSIRSGKSFAIGSSQTRALIQYLKGIGLPESTWDEFVSPHAHHFQPIRQEIGPQYPVGAPWVLSLFPEGEAVRDVNLGTEWLLYLAAVGAILLSAFSGARAAGTFFALTFVLAFEILKSAGTSSYSINTSLVPILAAIWMAFLAEAASERKHENSALLFSVASGAFAGLTILIRIASLLLIPGALLILAPRRRLLAAFSVSVAIFGLLPLLQHRIAVAGKWYLSTYNSADVSLPSIAAWIPNLDFYLGSGDGARYNWAPFCLLVATLGLIVWKRPQQWRRYFLAAFLSWAISVVFFLSHTVTTYYYLALASFACVLILSSAVLKLEWRREQASFSWVRSILMTLVAALGFGIVSLRVAGRGWDRVLPAPVGPVRSTWIPEVLRSDSSWVWADLTSGSFWYYGSKTAMKAPFGNRELRMKVAQWIQMRGDSLFLVLDSPDMEQIKRELESEQQHAIEKGQVFDEPLIEIVPSR